MAVIRSMIILLLNIILIVQISGLPDGRVDQAASNNSMLLAITVIEEPYVFYKDDHRERLGNDKYQGFSVDLLEQIALHVGFNFTIEPKNMSYGIPDERTGVWNGLIRELIDKRADLAFGALTISHSREQVIDFSKSFMQLGIGIIFQKPAARNAEDDLFFFLYPFHPNVWLCMATAYVALSIIIFLLAKFSHRSLKEVRDSHEDQVTFCNSLRFAIGLGSNTAPQALSSKIVAGCWWCFTIIMICCYTANLSAFLAGNNQMKILLPIGSAEDLSMQSSIKYGCYAGGATCNFFKQSKLPVYKRMWEFMSQDPSNFVNSSRQGINRVKTEHYAYLMESTSLEYAAARDCQLTQIGGLLDSKGYGIALPQNSSYREQISLAILQLQENSELRLLRERWWTEKHGDTCEKSKPSGRTGVLRLSRVGGVFIFLLIGLTLAFAAAAVEFIWIRKTSSRGI